MLLEQNMELRLLREKKIGTFSPKYMFNTLCFHLHLEHSFDSVRDRFYNVLTLVWIYGCLRVSHGVF